MEPQKQNGKRKLRTYGFGARGKVSKAERPTDIVQLSYRMTEATRTRLVEEARRRGVSLNAEITLRIDRSFWLDDMLKARLLSARVPASRSKDKA